MAHYKLGKLYFRAGRLNVAEKSYLSAIAIAPEQSALHAGLGAVYYLQDRFDEALVEYKAALTYDASLVHAQVGIAVIHHRRGEFEDAFAAYQTALRLDAEAHYALNGLARLYLEGASTSASSGKKKDHIQETIALAEKAVRLAPVPQYLQTLALAYFQAGAHQAALKTIRTAIEMEPGNDAFRQTLARMKESDEKTK